MLVRKGKARLNKIKSQKRGKGRVRAEKSTHICRIAWNNSHPLLVLALGVNI
jgi:hypothetical protein